jgi:hypothetical protein
MIILNTIKQIFQPRKSQFKMHNRFFFGLKFVGFALLFLLFAGGATMLLWNWLMPAVFGLPVLSLLQAFGLLVLTRILVGGFSRGGRHWGGGHKPWMHKMRARWEQMSPEERERWKSRMQDCRSGARGPWEMPPMSETEAPNA